MKPPAVDPSDPGVRVGQLSHLAGQQLVEVPGALPKPIARGNPDMRLDRGDLDRMSAIAAVGLPPALLDPLDQLTREDRGARWSASRGEPLAHRDHVGARLAAWNWNQRPTLPNPVTVSSAIQSAPASRASSASWS